MDWKDMAKTKMNNNGLEGQRKLKRTKMTPNKMECQHSSYIYSSHFMFFMKIKIRICLSRLFVFSWGILILILCVFMKLKIGIVYHVLFVFSWGILIYLIFVFFMKIKNTMHLGVSFKKMIYWIFYLRWWQLFLDFALNLVICEDIFMIFDIWKRS